MNFYSFARFFGVGRNKQAKRSSRRPQQRKEKPRCRLLLEALEDRTVPATVVPTISSITESALTTSQPTVTINFSELMQSSTAANTSNYLLIDSSGEPINAISGSAANDPTNKFTVVTLKFSGPLLVDTYSLFVQEDKIFESTGTVAMAQSPQLIAANGGSNNFDNIVVNNNGTLGAISQYPMPAVGTNSPNPDAILFTDLNKDSLPDMLVANSTTDQLAIFLGQGSSNGFSYNTTPDVTLDLPAGTAKSAEAIAVGDFDKDGNIDIAVANASTNNVTVFLQTPNTFGFSAGTSYAAGTNPLGLVATDLNGDGNIDLATVNGTLNGINWQVSVLPGAGDGTFGTAVNTTVGTDDTSTSTTTGLQTPTSIAAGNLFGGTKTDLAVGGSNGVATLQNKSTTTTWQFNVTQVTGYTASTGAIAIGHLSTTSANDVVAAATNGVFDLQNDGKGNLSSVQISGAVGSTDIKLADVNGDGSNEVVVANSAAANGLSVLTPAAKYGIVKDASNPASGPIVIKSSGHGLNTGDQVYISGVQGNTNANGLWTVTFVDANDFSLDGSSPNADYTSGGIWDVVSRAVQDASDPTSGLIEINSPNHGLHTGDQIVISGVQGNTAANGTFTVTVVDANNFTLNGTTAGNGTYVTGTGSWVTVSHAITAATNAGPIKITSANHGLFTGEQIIITGGQGNTAVNGTFTVTVVDANTFTLNGSTGNGTYGGGAIWAPAGFAYQAVTGSPFDTAKGAAALSVADVNSDGNLDIGVANLTANDVVLYSGKGDLTFQKAQATSVTPTPTRQVALGDFNGDGIPDVVVVNDDTNNDGKSFITVALGLTGGGYSTPVNYSPPTFKSGGFGGGSTQSMKDLVSVAVGDVDGDGLPDIVVVDRADSRLGILENTGKFSATGGLQGGSAGGSNSTFTASSAISVGSQPSQVVLANLTGHTDKSLDILVSHNGKGGFGGGQPGVTELINQGKFTFGPTGFFGSVGKEVANGISSASAIAVGDFNKDNNLDFIVADAKKDQIVWFQGDGTGNFNQIGTYGTAVDSASALVVGDFNSDGFSDVAVVSDSTSSTAGGVSVLLNSLGSGFNTAIQSNVLVGTGMVSAVATDLNRDGKLDLIVSTDAPPKNTPFYDNIFAIFGNSDGTFSAPVPFLAGNPSDSPVAPPTYLALTSNPFVLVTTFQAGGTTVFPNLIINGDFEQRDLNSNPGNLLGWQVYDAPLNPGGSHGTWAVQSGTLSPISGASVPAPTAKYRAMLDEQDLTPLPQKGQNPNANSTYEGTHVLYQDVAIPAGATKVTLSLSLYLNSSGAWSDPTSNSSLDFRTSADNQQVRIDIIDPNGDILSTDSSTGLLKNEFITKFKDAQTQTITVSDANLSAFAGKTIRLRIVGVNNRGKLIVGVDNVSLKAQFPDTASPTLSNLRLRNGGITIDGVQHTTDPTLIGQIGDIGTMNNMSNIEFDIGSTQLKTNTWDVAGNFFFTIPNLSFGENTVTVTVTDKAGNQVSQIFTFWYQGSSATVWQAYGPNAISTAGQGVNYTDVTGRVTSIAVDTGDKTGNTYYVGSDNGGVWKTTDGGKNWTPLTDYLTDGSGNPVATPIGALAVAPSDPNTVYAGLGVADNQPNSRSGSGVLISTDAGQTWTVSGADVFANARISRIVVDPNHSDIVYVAVASGGKSGPGVYQTTNGGQTWIDVLDPTKMYTTGGTTLGSNVALANVTDLFIDPFNANRLEVGLGNIGLPDANGVVLDSAHENSTAGVWLTVNQGSTWSQVVGDNSGGILPSGSTLGRVTIAMATGRPGDEAITYYLIGTPPSQVTPPSVGDGGFMGLYTSRDNLLTFTKISMRQNTAGAGLPSFSDIDLLGKDGAYAGALLVDPSDPYVLYVGGSQRFSNNTTVHSLIRVDTGNMNTSTGDDKTKAAAAAMAGGYYDPGNDTDPYTGEGVFWYDITENASNNSGQQTLLPPTIHALAFDPNGRLLIGTEGGLWRGSNYGFVYDYTSGGQGIVNGKTPKMNGMTITSLNNNLQITDLTSVAIDPSNPSTLYSTQYSLGASGTSGLLNWVSEGFTGPVVNGSNLGIPTAATIAAAAPNPGDPAGTPTVLYRVWQYASSSALVVEVSEDGGSTWSALNATGINPNDTAGMFPPFVINPAPVFVGLDSQGNPQYANELLFGTSRVWWTLTSGNVWDALSTGSLGKGKITAMGLPGVVTAGPVQNATNAGPIVITSSNNGLSTGDLVNITGVTGNTAANGTFTVTKIDNNTFSLNGSKGNGTYVNGGIWTKVNGLVTGAAAGTSNVVVITSANHGLITGEQVHVSGVGGNSGANGTYYVTVIDANHFSLKGSVSKGTYTSGGIWSLTSSVYYAGTDQGEVFETLDRSSWTEVDTNGLPHPTTGPKPTVNGITVDPHDPKTAYVMLGGTNFTGHVWVTHNAGKTWSSLNVSGNGLPDVPAYALVIDPNKTFPAPNGKLFVATDAGIFFSKDQGKTWSAYGQGLPNAPVVGLQLSPSGNVMAAAIQGRGAFSISIDDIGPHVTSISNTLTTSSVTVTFNKAIDAKSFTTSQVSLTGPGGSVTPLKVINDNTLTNQTFTITFASTATQGAYTVKVGPSVADTSGNLMDQNQNLIQGENPGDIYAGRFIYQPISANHAPVLSTTTATAPSVLENASTANNTGFTVASFMSNLSISDSDTNAIKGIAITSVDNTNGKWQYSLNGGNSWNDFGSVTSSSARLLENSTAQRIRFLPNTNFFTSPHASGVTVPTFKFHAWDLTTDLSTFNGASGGTADIHLSGDVGGSTAYSTTEGTASLQVVNVNQAPAFTVGPNQSVLESAAAQSVPDWAKNITAGPGEDAIQTVSFTVTNNNNALFTSTGQPAVDSTGKLTFTPATGVAGTAIVSVVLKDNGGTANGGVNASAAKTFTITILPVNQAPTMTLAGTHITVQPTGTGQSRTNWVTNVTPGPTSESSQTLTFTVTNDNNALFTASGQPAIVRNGTTGTLTFTPATTAHGIATVTVTLKDNGGTSNGGHDTTVKTFTISVNNPPTLGTIGTQNMSHTSTGLNLTLTATDKDTGDTLTYLTPVVKSANSKVTLPAGAVVVSTPDAATGAFTITTNGTFVGSALVTVGATDTFDTTTETFQVNVTNTAPTLSQIANQTLNHRDTYSVDLSTLTNDVDGDILTYAASINPSTAANVQLSGSILTITPALKFTGTATVTYSVSDSFTTTKKTFTLTVVNHTPVLSNPGNKTMTHGVNSIDVTLNATDADTNDQANLTYSAKITSPSNAPVTVTHSGNVFTFTLSGIVSGTFTVQATASDGLATSSPVTFTITMPNHAPVFDTTPTDITAAHDTTPPTVSISATDADNDSLTYGASVTRYTALYDLKTKYALAVDATHAQNYGGANEKWLRGAGNKFFFIKPDGTFYQWNGTLHKATGTKLATLPPSVYSDTSLLYAAVNPPTTPGTATLSGSDVTITPATNFVGVFQVKFTVTDGYVITSKTVWVTFTNVPVTLAAISNQTMSAGTSLDVSLNVSDPDGDSLTSKVDIQGYNQLYNLDKQYGFFVDPTGYHQNFHFQNEKWIRAASGKWYAIKPNGQLWLLGNTNIRGGAGAFATLIATLDTSVYSDPTLLTKAYYNETTKTFSTAPTAPSVTYSLNSSNTVLTLTPPSGFTGVFQVTVTFSDGPSTASRTFFVTVS